MIPFIIGTVLVIGACGLGLMVVPKQIAPASLRMLSGIPLFIILGTTISAIPYVVGSTFIALIVIISFAVILAVFAGFRGVYKDIFTIRQASLVLVLIAIGYAVMIFAWSESSDGTIRTIPGAWGDGALHVLNAQYIANGPGAEPLAMPAFTDTQIREPFGYSLFSGMMLMAGFSIGSAFTIPAALVLACLLGWSGWLAAGTVRRDTSSRIGKRGLLAFVIASYLVLFGGGLQWMVMAFKESAWTPLRFFGVHGAWDKSIEQGLAWANHINIFASQRHTLLVLAFVVVLATILIAVSTFYRAERKDDGMLLMILAVSSGMLAFFHAHGFIGVLLLWIIFALFGSRYVSVKKRYFLLAIVAVVAFPFFVWYMGAVLREGFIALAPGYIASFGPYPWIVFWIINLGAFPFLAIFAVVDREYGIRRHILGISAGALFFIGNIFQFQPYLWDNIKLFQIAWILLLPLVVAELVMLASRKGFYMGIAVIVIATLSLTSLSEIATFVHFRQNIPIYSALDRKVGSVLKEHVPEDAVVLAATDQRHNHPLTLTGRRLALGYGGWIWTRGLPLEQRTEDVRAVLQAESLEGFCSSTANLGITYVVVTDAERTYWNTYASSYVRSLVGLDDSAVYVTNVGPLCSEVGR